MIQEVITCSHPTHALSVTQVCKPPKLNRFNKHASSEATAIHPPSLESPELRILVISAVCLNFSDKFYLVSNSYGFFQLTGILIRGGSESY